MPPYDEWAEHVRENQRAWNNIAIVDYQDYWGSGIISRWSATDVWASAFAKIFQENTKAREDIELTVLKERDAPEPRHTFTVAGNRFQNIELE